MTFIYDVLLNFQDKNRLVEFFEWEDNDMLEHVKRISLFRIPSVDMDHFCFSDVKVDKEFLNRFKGKVLLYKRKKTTFYGCLFCDLNRVVAVEFSSSGEIIARSCLLLDEEDEVIESAKDLEVSSISYKVLKREGGCSFLTREEEFERHYLYREFVSLFEEKNVDKLTYLYEEIFGVDNLDFSHKYQRIIQDLEVGFDQRYHKLFDIVQLSYSKK